jgi:paraquat-inducible protein B
MSDQHEPTALPSASPRRPRRVSIIWVIPIVAVAIGVWLAWDTLSKQGTTITISFESGEGLQAGQSQLKYKDIVFGTVQSLALSPDQSRVLVTVATTREAEPLLTQDTEFWVVKPGLVAGSIRGLGTLFSGVYIGMLPRQLGGKRQREFVGLEDPPVLEVNVPGRVFLLTASRLGSISLGSPVFFHDIEVGQVLKWDLTDMADTVTIHAFVRAPFDSYVHDETRFWNASGISVKLTSTGVHVQMESLRALLLGGIEFSTPTEFIHAEVSAEKHVFPLFADQDTANAASYTHKIQVLSYFSSSVRGLGPGSEVSMQGFTIGDVTDVRLVYDPVKDKVLAPVRFEVEPERVLGVGRRAFKTPAEGIDDLVKRGLRATLESTSLITGQQAVVLKFIPDAPPATVSKEGDYFVLPTVEGGGFAGLEAAATELLNKVNTIPFEQIGKNLDGILHAVNDAANGPQMRQTLTDLAATLASAKEFTKNLDTGTAPMLQRLPEISAQLEKAMTNANRLILSVDNGYGDNTQFNRDLDRLLVQANDAVRSIRALADLLARHPEALVKGRPEGGQE